MNGKISHKGVIEHINGKHIKVRIIQSSACSSCQAKAICSSSESKEKIIDIYDSSVEDYSIGENVNVCASETMGRNAVILAFVLPLALILIWIILSVTYIKISELISIGGAFLLLTLYYTTLYFNRKRISKTFSFWIEKL